MNDLQIKELREKLGVTQKKLAEMVGVSEKTIQNWEAGGVIPKSKHPILRSVLNIELKQQVYFGGQEEETTTTMVPLLPTYAQGGTLNDFAVSVKRSECEMIVSPIKDADFAIPVAGESMSPEYPSGSQLLIKKIDEKAFIDWGKVYVLDTCNGTVIKRLFPSENPGILTCKSINPDFPPFEVNLKDVFGVYRVLLCMSIK